MSEIVNQSLQKVAKGSILILCGTAISMLLGFVGRVIVVRYITQGEYGIYSLALVVVSIFGLIATLGLSEGSARQIAFYRGKGDTSKVQGLVSSSMQLSLIASIVLCVVCFFTADFIATQIFYNSELITPLRIFSFALPFLTLTAVSVSIFR